MPTYVSSNILKVPNKFNANVHEINTDKLEKKIDAINNFCTSEISKLNFSVQHVNSQITNLVHTLDNLKLKPNTKLWSDAVPSPNTNMNINPLNINNSNKRIRTSTHEIELEQTGQHPNQPPPNPSKSSKSNSNNILFIGKNKKIATKLNNGIPVIKKNNFYLSKGPRCSSTDTVNYFASHNIKLISCYPVLKQSSSDPKTVTDQSTVISSSFRICIDNNDTTKFLNPDILPEDATLQYWQFKPKQTT